jgi:hypothetical protein
MGWGGDAGWERAKPYRDCAGRRGCVGVDDQQVPGVRVVVVTGVPRRNRLCRLAHRPQRPPLRLDARCLSGVRKCEKDRGNARVQWVSLVAAAHTKGNSNVWYHKSLRGSLKDVMLPATLCTMCRNDLLNSCMGPAQLKNWCWIKLVAVWVGCCVCLRQRFDLFIL